MMEQWQQYCEKFLKLSPREKYMIIIAGFVVVLLLPYALYLDETTVETQKLNRQVTQLKQDNRNAESLIQDMEFRLAQDPNVLVEREVAMLEERVKQTDEQLLSLTSELINPVAMRAALSSLLNMHKGVALLSFEVKPGQPLIMAQAVNADASDDDKQENQFSGLYKHEISLTLKGKYFSLRDYLAELETLKWKFFWQDFDYQLIEYPNGELAITLYSLSTQKEFLGV